MGLPTIFKRFTKREGDVWSTMPPLHWAPVSEHEHEADQASHKEGHVVAIVTCKNGHACALRLPPHTLSVAGVIHPSLGCPVKGCTGHEHGGSVLEGWTLRHT